MRSLMASFNTLRAISNRLNNTPIHELPQQVGHLATSLASCKHVVQGLSAGGNDNAVLLHKLKTRISALLQDRSSEGRMSGIVMVKAMVEAGGLSLLSESGSWVRNLITCLNKSDPWEVKRLGLMTIARIYILTLPHQALIREITIPTLPAFISASLTAIKPATTVTHGKTIRALSPLLETVLIAWHVLIEHFASTFRPHVTSLRAISLSLLSDQRCPSSVSSAATRLLARLHFCAPRNNAESEWSQTCGQVIEAAHDTADLLFRAVVEDWKPSTSRLSKVTQKQKSADIPATRSIDSIGLDLWSGLSEGMSRLTVHINLLQQLLVSAHFQAVQIPLGNVFDLTSRLSAVTAPTQKFSLRVNSEITRDEREELWMNVPQMHTAILELFKALVEVYGQTLLPVADAVITQLWDIVEAEINVDTVRAAIYNLVSSLLSHKLFRTDKSDSENISILINHCCDDLKIQSGLTTVSNGLNGNSAVTPELTLSTKVKKDSFSLIAPPNPSLYEAAYEILPLILTHVPFHLIPGSNSLRTNLDSTAILIQHHEAILASTLNPPQSRSKMGKLPAPSLMPFLARIETNSPLTNLAKEALLRPRMPVIRSTVADDDNTEDPDPDHLEDTHINNMHPQLTFAMDAITYTSQQQSKSRSSIQIDSTAEFRDTDTNGSPNKSQGGAIASSQQQPDTHFPTTAQKRDFTALLEQSANAQLAADGVSPSRFGDASEEAEAEEKFIPKKARMDETVIQGAQYAKSTPTYKKTENNVTVDVVDVEMRTQDQEESENAVVISVDETRLYNDQGSDSNILAADNANRAVKGKGKAILEDDDGDGYSDSSDSEIPTIDATLAVGVLEDSEEEEEDDEEGGENL